MNQQRFNKILPKQSQGHAEVVKPVSCLLMSWWCEETGLDKAWSISTHLPLDKMVAVSQTIFSAAFLWMKSFVLWLKFHWSLFLRVKLAITQHWFRLWLGAEQAASHYLNQCWPDSLMHICGTRGRWVNSLFCVEYLVHEKNCLKVMVVQLSPMASKKWCRADEFASGQVNL